jgi:hypothetical protein
MKDKVRCKACGYILEKDALGEVCPACGVKKEMFEPWEDKVGEFRRKWLEFDFHPVTVHFPVGLSALTLLLVLTFPLFAGFGDLQGRFLFPATAVPSWILPVTVLGGIITGMADSKVRYRKVATPALLRKIIVGFVLFISSSTQAALVAEGDFSTATLWLGYLAAAVVSMACAATLGIWGAKLMVGVMPGDKFFMKKKKKPAKAAEAKKE